MCSLEKHIPFSPSVLLKGQGDIFINNNFLEIFLKVT